MEDNEIMVIQRWLFICQEVSHLETRSFSPPFPGPLERTIKDSFMRRMLGGACGMDVLWIHTAVMDHTQKAGFAHESKRCWR